MQRRVGLSLFYDHSIKLEVSHLPDGVEHFIANDLAILCGVESFEFHATVSWNGVAALFLCRVPLLVIRAQLGGRNDPSRLKALKPDLHIGVTVCAGHFHKLAVPGQINAMITRWR